MKTISFVPSALCPAAPAKDSRRIGRQAATVTALIMAQGLATTGFAAAAEKSAQASATDPVKLDALTVESDRVRQRSNPKFTEPLVDTPQTVVVVPQLVIEQQGATSLSDVLRNTPGITFAAGEGGNVASGDSFFMRGSDASGNIFVDGVRDTGAYTRDVFNLEQVEIAKGPAGADNGRGGTSGYVNLASKAPRLESFASGTAGYGSAARARATFDVNRPVENSPVRGTAFRLNAMWQDGGTPGRDSVTSKSWGLSPSLALGLGTPTRVTLAASYLEQDNVPDSGLPIVAAPGGAVLPAGVPALATPVRQENFFGLAAADFEQVTSRGVTARVEHDFARDVALTNQTRLATNERDALTSYIQSSSTAASTFAAATTPLNPATGAVPPSYFGYVPATATAPALIGPRRLRTQQENEIVSNQTNLSVRFATGPVRHRLNLGAEFTRETQDTPTWQPVGGPPTSLHAPDARRAVTAAQIPYQATNNPSARARTDTAAGYVFDSIQLHPRLLLTASARRERYETDYASLAAATATAPAPAPVRIEAEGSLLSWKSGLVFKPAPDGSLYVAYGNSFTPAGSAFALSATANNQNNPNLDPQEARNAELGIKWDFLGKRLSTSLAFYRSENLNVVSTDAVTGLVTQDISQRVQGVEFGVSGKISERWLVFGGFGYIDSEQQAAGTTAAATTEGAALRFTPRLSGNLWTTYILRSGLTLGGGAQYSESVVRSTALAITSTTPSLSSVPSYWVYNLMADYAVNQRLSFRLNVNNVSDTSYFRLNNNGGRYYPGAPRSYQLTANFKL